MEQNKKAFTLVELMVAMAIIAVLIGLAGFGISTLQRLSRDNQRRQTVVNISTYIEGYYNDFLEYPDYDDLDVTETKINIIGYSLPGPDLQGPARISGTGTSTIEGTVYCYDSAPDGYRLGAMLEGGGSDPFFNSGTSQQETCDINSTGVFLVP
jgi:prepilin-type N-terminal cleavage/methylation domain-containing protein